MRGSLGFGIDILLSNARYGISAAVDTITFWLQNVTNTTASVPSDGSKDATFSRGGSTATVRAWDSTNGLTLVTTAANGVAVEGLRYDSGTWYNDDGSGNSLTPVKTYVDADGNSQEVYVEVDARADSTAYSIGDYYWMASSNAGHNLYAQCTAAGTSAASAPSVALTDTSYTDGTATFEVQGRYSNLGSLPGLLHEQAATNYFHPSKVEAGWAAASNATFSASVSDPFGGTDAGTVTATANNGTYAMNRSPSTDTIKTASLWVKRRTGTGTIELLDGNNTAWETISVSSDWQRFEAIGDTSNTNATVGVRLATSGDAVDIYHAQCEGGSKATSPIPTTTSTVTRAATSETSPAVFTAQYIRCRASQGLYAGEVLLSDGTNTLTWTGTDLTFTDSVTTLTAASVALTSGDDIVIDTVDGKLYVNGVLKDTDAALSPTWGTLTVIGNITDLAESSSLDPTDQTWKTL